MTQDRPLRTGAGLTESSRSMTGSSDISDAMRSAICSMSSASSPLPPAALLAPAADVAAVAAVPSTLPAPAENHQTQTIVSQLMLSNELSCGFTSHSTQK